MVATKSRNTIYINNYLQLNVFNNLEFQFCLGVFQFKFFNTMAL